jgi:hypothetical protein
MKGLGKLAKYQQHNLAPSYLSSPLPSMVILYHPKEVGEVEICLVLAQGRWETSPTEKLAQNCGIILFFMIF